MSDPTNAQPFYVLSAQVRLYTVDAGGNPLAQQWLGGTIDRISLKDEFIERRVEYHGRTRAKIYHEDERWAVTFENVRAVDLSSPSSPQPVSLRRNQEYALVIVWWDLTRANVWLKRSYFGVKAQPANMRDPRNIDQVLQFSAEEMTEIAGTGTPDFTLVRTGQVYYIDGSQKTQIYEFDPTNGFVAVDSLVPSAANIDLSTPGQVTITIGGVQALFADGTKVQAALLTAVGGSVLDDTPRLEFWSAGVRCAALSVNQFVAPNLTEQNTAPVATIDVPVMNGVTWLFSMTSAGAFAPQWKEGG